MRDEDIDRIVLDLLRQIAPRPLWIALNPIGYSGINSNLIPSIF